VNGTTTFRIDGAAPVFDSIADARTAANALVFFRETGIASSSVIALYLRADANANGYLSWDELETFQDRLYRRYEYRQDATALRPDEFPTAGGGDCEAWALLTAGLCRFWGWATYLASIGPGRQTSSWDSLANHRRDCAYI